MDVADLARAYWAQYERTMGDRTQRVEHAHDDDEAVDAVEHAIRRGGRDAVELIAGLVAAAPDDAALAYLGAGPMEDLLGAHGPSVIEAIDEHARQDARFRYALRCAWFESRLPADLAIRLRRHGNPP